MRYEIEISLHRMELSVRASGVVANDYNHDVLKGLDASRLRLEQADSPSIQI
jgi:hypothetical protein